LQISGQAMNIPDLELGTLCTYSGKLEARYFVS
jgi:hypothetical protein